MAVVLSIGKQSDYDDSSLYDLTDTSADNIHALYRLPERPNPQLAGIEVGFQCGIRGSSDSDVVDQEKELRDHIDDAIKFVRDKNYDEATYLWESADGETAKRAVITGGGLSPVPMQYFDPLMPNASTMQYVLTMTRGPWEGITEITAINAAEFDGVNNTDETTSVKGDTLGRLSQFTIAATADNTESDPLTEAWMGFRPIYDGMSSFDPVWDLEYASTIDSDAETNIATSNDSDTYPNGSTANNAVEVDFGDTVMEKRVAISLLDSLQGGTNLITNGDAETGDKTGWTETFAGLSADSDQANNGSYGFYADLDTDDASSLDYQDFAVTAGESYFISFSMKCISQATDGQAVIYCQYLDSDDGGLNYAGFEVVDAVQAWTDYTIVSVAPSNGAKIRVTITGECTGNGDTIEFAVDDIEVYTGYQDHWTGDYLALLRCKNDTASKETGVYATFGYVGSSALQSLTDPQIVTNTSWKLVPLGVVSFPPKRRLTDENQIWRIGNLGFEIWCQDITGDAHDFWMDAIILIPAKHSFWINGMSVSRSSNYANDSKTSDLDIFMSDLDEMVIIPESEDYKGVNSNYDSSHNKYGMPDEDNVLVCFAQTATHHTIATDFTVTAKYYDRHKVRNAD